MATNQTKTKSQIQDELDMANKKNEELSTQLAEMMEMIKALQTQQVSTVSTAAEESVEEDFEEELNIPDNKMIQVVSLVEYGVTIRTVSGDGARKFNFERLGQQKSISYSNLMDCYNTTPWIFEKGLLYIKDKQAVKSFDLEEFYENFLTVNQIKNILNLSVDEIEDLVSKTTENIKETIIVLTAKKINEEKNIDLNKVAAIERACGVDIREIAEKIQ